MLGAISKENPILALFQILIPVGKLTEPNEIAKLSLFLLSEDNKTITGQTINANGGMYFG